MDSSPGDDNTLGGFVRAHRQRVRPAQVGLVATDGAPRRTPGLRREELAAVAGISLPYLIRVEQDRAGRPSDQVLDALARALRLDAAHRAHLHRLAAATTRPRRRPAGIRPPSTDRAVPREMRGVLDALQLAPAFLMGRRTEVLAWNTLGGALHADLVGLPVAERNMTRLLFCNEATRALYPDWEQVARDTVGALRCDAGRHPHDPALAALVGDLSLLSTTFRTWWAQHHVHAKHTGTKRFRHPLVGDLTLQHQTLSVADRPDLTLVVYAAPSGSPDADRLTLLGSLTATSSTRQVGGTVDQPPSTTA